MKSLGLFLIIFTQSLAGLSEISAFKSYKDYKVYNVTPTTDTEIKTLYNFEDDLKLDIWDRIVLSRSSRIMVPPFSRIFFEKMIKNLEIEFNVLVEDLEEVLEKERRNMKLNAQRFQSSSNQINFDHFWSLREFEWYSDFVAYNYPNLVKKEIIGDSIEGREIFSLKISKNQEFGKNPVIFLESGIHSREWVGPMSTIYLAHQLIENSAQNSELLNVDWVIVPVANPDGYEYTHTHDRMWKKNRRIVTNNCVGVELNSNFPFQYQAGASCSSTQYPGSKALSEPETKALSKAVLEVKSNLKLYLSIHSCGNLAIYPWGYTYPAELVDNWREHHDLGEKFSDVLKEAINEPFQVGNSAAILFSVNGGSDDYAYSVGSELVFTLELPCGGSQGFNYPESKIGDLNRGMFKGYEVMGKYISEKHKVVSGVI